MTTPVTVQGRVVNAITGLPVARALVRINERAILTDHEGKFLFDQVTDATLNFQLTKPGYSASSDPSDPPTQFFQTTQLPNPLELQLFPEALLTGTLIGPDGQPLPRMSVMARRCMFDESGIHWMISGQSQTDLHGDFRIPVPAGDYKLETRFITRNTGERDAVLPVTVPVSDGLAHQVIHLHSGEEQRFDLRPAVRRTYPLSITIENATDRGLPQITARANNGMILNIGAVPSHTPGRATLYLPAGSYRLSAKMQNQNSTQIAETTVTVTGGDAFLANGDDAENGGAVLRFVSVPSIAVEVAIDSNATSDNSTPQSGGSTVIPQGSGQIAPPSPAQLGLKLQKIDTDGSDDNSNGVELTASGNRSPAFTPAPGSYRLVARGFGPWFVKSASYGSFDLLGQGLVVSAGGSSAPIRLLVSNQTGSLQGTVNLKGQPGSGCWVYLISTTPSATPILSMRSNSDGSINNPYLPPGSYQAIGFEHRHQIDFTDQTSLAPYSTYIQAITITSGAQAKLNLNAVPQTEIKP